MSTEEKLDAILKELAVLKKTSSIVPRYCREEEAAKYLGYSVKTLQKYRSTKTKAIPYIKDGYAVFYDICDLDNWMAVHKVGAANAMNQ